MSEHRECSPGTIDDLVSRWHKEANNFRVVAMEMHDHGDAEEGTLCNIEADRLDQCASELRAASAAQASLEISQHIGWLKQYVEGMTADNWRDMQLRAERQLEKLCEALALPSTHQSAPAVNSSLPSGESDPAVTLDCAGADTASTLSRPDREAGQ